MTRTLLLAFVVIATAAGGSFAAQVLPDSEMGRRAAAYLELFHRGDEAALRRFLASEVAPEALVRRPVEERVATWRSLRETYRTLTPTRLVAARHDEIEIEARSGTGATLGLTFAFEDQAPHRLLGLRIVEESGDDEAPPEAVSVAATDDEAIAAWSVHLDSLARADQFSGVALLARDDKTLFQTAYGFASRADRVPNRVTTKFNVGSIDKLFTKLAIAQLVAANRVKLDDTIDRYLPDFPHAVASRVTVRQLLEHRGGVTDIFGPAYDRADRSRLRTVADWVALIRDQPLRFEPGSRQEYSNGGYVLLGAIVEKVSGEDYYDYVRRHVTGPLGMNDTDWYVDGSVPGVARGYTRRPGAGGKPDAAGWGDNAPSRPMRGSPAGGGYSTVDDLLRFARAIRSGRLVPPALARDFRELVPEADGRVGLGVGGGAPGLNAAVELKGPYTVVVLANLDPPTAETAARWLSRRLPGPGGGGERVVVAGHAASGERGGAVNAEGERPEILAHPPEHPERTIVPPQGVDVEMLRSGHLPAVEIRLNGRGPYRFAIDTGAGGTARIDSALAASLGLEVVGQVRSGDPSGRNARVSNVVGIGTLEIGGARFEGLNAAVRGDSERRLVDGTDGILGFGLFRDCLLTLDYPANRVRLATGSVPAKGDGVVSFSMPHGIPAVTLRVDTLELEADVDVGSMGGLSLPASYAAKLPLAGPLRTVGRARTVGNEFEIQAAPLNGVARLGDVVFDHPTVEFQPIFPVANVGSRVLKDFALTFDARNGRMRLARSTSP